MFIMCPPTIVFVSRCPVYYGWGDRGGGVFPLKPLCLGNMAATAALRGKKRISDCLWLLSISELSSDISPHNIISLSKSCVWVCVCWSPEQQERAGLPLDPAVSPWRVTGLWKYLFSLKMEISLLRRGKGFVRDDKNTIIECPISILSIYVIPGHIYKYIISIQTY